MTSLYDEISTRAITPALLKPVYQNLTGINVIQRYIFHFKVHEIPVSGYLVMAYFTDFKSSKGNNSCITEASLVKLDVRQRVITIQILF